MKKQLPLDCGPKGMCGKCVPCLGMQKLLEKQQNIPAKCFSKLTKPPSTQEPELIGSIYAFKNTKRNRGGRGDENSSDSDSDSTTCYEKCPKSRDSELIGRNTLPKQRTQATVSISRKPATAALKKPPCIEREESEEIIYIRKPTCVKREESFETVYSRKPTCVKREESFDTVYSRKPKCVKREESFETIYSRKPAGIKREESFETVCSKIPKCVKRKESDETVYSKRAKCVKREESEDTVFITRPKGIKRKDSDETVCTGRCKRKECAEQVCNPRKLKSVAGKNKKKFVEGVSTSKKKVVDESGKGVSSRKDAKRPQPSASNTSIPDEGVDDYANYIPRMCIQQKERPKSREIRAGISYIGCDCGKRNGLQDQCKRTECQGCPKCKQFPPACYLSRYTNARHLTKLKDAGIKKKCPYVDKKGNVLIST